MVKVTVRVLYMAMQTEVRKEEKFEKYIIRDELVQTSPGEKPLAMINAYALDGSYIGSQEDAEYLCIKRGIKPQRRIPDIEVATIGFCEKERKWYGWSHRAIAGFGIGDTTGGLEDHVCRDKLGPSYTAMTLEDAKNMASVFADEVG
jgi:hypothetical protein